MLIYLFHFLFCTFKTGINILGIILDISSFKFNTKVHFSISIFKNFVNFITYNLHILIRKVTCAIESLRSGLRCLTYWRYFLFLYPD